MSTRSSARNLFPPLDNSKLTIRKRSRTDPTLLNDFEMAAEGNDDPPVPDLWTIEELCQPSLNGRGGPITPIAIQATNFGLKNDMTQQSIKVNGVTDDALRLCLFPHSLTHHLTAWFDRLRRNSIITFEQMAKIFLGKYFPPSMVTKLRNEITNFCGTFMKRHPEEWYDLIENMTAHHNDWDTSSQRITPNYETCGGPDSYNDCPATVGQTQNVYVAGVYQGGNSYQPQGASHDQNLPPAYQAPAYQASGYQAPIHQPPIPQQQVVTTNEFTNFMKANDSILKNMQTNMTSLTNSNFKLRNMFGQFMKMNTASSSGSGTLPGNTVINPKEDLKGTTTHSGTAYQGPTIPTTSSSLPKVVERETEVTKDTMPPTNNESTKDIQPPIVQTETPILNSKPVVAPTERDFIDIFEGELTLLVGKEAITFNLDKTSRYSANYNDMTVNRIDVIDMACEEYSQEVLNFFDVIVSGNPTPYYDPVVSTSSLTLTPFKDIDFLLEKIDAFLALEDDPTSPKVDQSYFDPEEDILLLEAFLNDDPSLPPPNQGKYLRQVRKELKIYEPKTDKSSIDEPPEVELKDLPPHLEYVFLEVFMDDFSVFGNSFQTCLSHLEKMLKRCEDTNLCLNWEKSHFMVKEGIVLGHKISKDEIEVDKAKLDVIAKLPHPTTVKGVVLGKCQEKHFRPIHYARKTMTEAELNYTTSEKEMLAVVYAFEKFRSYLIMNKSIVYTDHSALKYLFAKNDSNPRLLC
nr:retrovirus-related Pol polyprotein from transposon 17.6 [Tanacetum cinerariifolium]